MKKPLIMSRTKLCAPMPRATSQSGGARNGHDIEMEDLQRHQNRGDDDDRNAGAVEDARNGASLLLAHPRGAVAAFFSGLDDEPVGDGPQKANA